MRLIQLIVALCVSPAILVAAQEPPPEERFLDWTNRQFPLAEYEARRESMVERLRGVGGGVFLIPSGDGVTHGTTYRQTDGFNYFVGLELPNSVLVLDVDHSRSILFLPARDYRFDNPDRRNDFPGRPLGDDPSVRAAAGAAETRPTEDLSDALVAWAEAGVTVWVDTGRGGEPEASVPDLTGGVEPQDALLLSLRRDYPTLVLGNAFPHVARLRMVKSPAEIRVLRTAAEATASSIRHAARFVMTGVDERTLEGEFELACKRSGSQRLAFSSIIKSGENSLWPWRVLAAQYDRRNRTMENGELVIFDVGCEMDYYSSDVGRTFPVNGTFSPRQREILEMVTGVADAIIEAVRPGVTLVELRRLAEATIPPGERHRMQTGSFYGHHVGLAVGDPALLDAPLEAGMVFTVEPWYYNHEEDIAFFVEDEVLVTPTGAELLTRALPRDAAGLEGMMQETRR